MVRLHQEIPSQKRRLVRTFRTFIASFLIGDKSMIISSDLTAIVHSGASTFPETFRLTPSALTKDDVPCFLLVSARYIENTYNSHTPRELVDSDLARLEGVQVEKIPPDYASTQSAYLKLLRARALSVSILD